MPKYWVKNYFAWEIPRSGSKAKDGGGKKKRRERLNDGNNNGQATLCARMAHASRLGQKRPKVGYNNGQAKHGARKLPRPKVVDLIIFGVISMLFSPSIKM